jgi:acetyl esterase
MTTGFPPLDWANDPADQLRRVYAAERAEVLADIPGDVEIDLIENPGLSGLVFTPPQIRSDVTILYFHGGGWIVGSPETHQTLCGYLSKLSGLKLISARYRLAPEHPFPAQAEDAVAALHAVEGPVILAGDSAGAAVALWAEAGAPSANIRCVIGLYGAFGLTDSASIKTLGPLTPGLTQPDIKALYRHLGYTDPHRLMEGFRASETPLCLVKAGLDPLKDDTTLLADGMIAQGRSVHLIHADQSSHGFLHFVGRDVAARSVMGDVARWLAAYTKSA